MWALNKMVKYPVVFFFFSILAFLGRRELNRISKVNFLLNHLKIDREI